MAPQFFSTTKTKNGVIKVIIDKYKLVNEEDAPESTQKMKKKLKISNLYLKRNVMRQAKAQRNKVLLSRFAPNQNSCKILSNF